MRNIIKDTLIDYRHFFIIGEKINLEKTTNQTATLKIEFKSVMEYNKYIEDDGHHSHPSKVLRKYQEVP
jgi:hypothetical protein